MKKVFIIYANFYNRDGTSLTIGGIQTYISMLLKIINELNMKAIIVQYGDINFEKQYENAEVHGVQINDQWSEKKKKKTLVNHVDSLFNSREDIVIFASDIMSIKNNFNRVIGIQHGVSWDIKQFENIPHLANKAFVFIKAYRALKTVIGINRFDILVAVDYNFLNWYRTQVAYLETNVKVIPNCTNIEHFDKVQSSEINIIFARRFNEYRGTRIFAESVKRLLKDRKNVMVTFAGEGPDESYLRNFFQQNQKIEFIKYNSKESIEVHKNYQIAVIPTIGSEGTSLSLLEAMAAKCAVIASNVGGITNIILDGYNGLLVDPNSDCLYQAMIKLVDDYKLRNDLSNNGFRTVSKSFSREVWDKRWKEVLSEMKNES